ncbi:hypothetical protein Avbf_07463, partial [Armadillidium vulgare]
MIGTCFTNAECKNQHGKASGDCANGYGVCCVILASCGSLVTVNNTYFHNPNHPSTFQGRNVCSVDIQVPKNCENGV